MTQEKERPPRYRGKVRYANKTTPGVGDAMGVRGLKTFGHDINEQWKTILRDRTRRMKLYLEMREDIVIGTLLDAIKLPLLEASFTVEPAVANSPADQEAADWLDTCLKKMDKQTWRSHVADCLDSLEFGFAVSEIVLDKRADGRMWLKNIDPRGQETCDGWDWDEDNPDIASAFRQRDPDTRKLYEIPLARCVHVTFRGRKGNPEGKSICDSLYESYRFYKRFKEYEGIGVERDVGGMPVATLPAEGDITDDDQDKLEAALKGMRNDEAMYLVAPAGVEVSPYGGGSKMYDVGAIIERYEKSMLGRMFGQFLKLGMDNVGTQALVKGSQGFFMLVLGGVQEYLKEAWNQQLIPYLFSFNQFDITELPTIEWEKPGDVDINAILTAISTAKGAGIYTPTDSDEDHVRDALDLPELPEEERGAPRDVEEPAGGFFEIKRKVEA